MPTPKQTIKDFGIINWDYKKTMPTKKPIKAKTRRIEAWAIIEKATNEMVYLNWEVSKEETIDAFGEYDTFNSETDKVVPVLITFPTKK